MQTRSLAQNVRIDEVLCLPHRIDVQGGCGGAGRGPLNENVDLDIAGLSLGANTSSEC